MVKRLIGTETTGSDGSCVIPYVGTGAGVVNLSVETEIDGSTVLRTLSVFDCYRHDDGTINSHNDFWTGLINTDLTREAEYTTIKEKTVGTTATITFTNIPLKNYRIECDVYQVDGTQDEWFITVLDKNYTAITSADSKLGEWKHISLDLTNIAQNSRVRLNTGGSCTELRFKNFMLYPYGDNDFIYINASNPVITNLGTTNITGTLFVDGVIQKNTNIDIYKNGTKVDTISTGSSGVASYTYTGSGAGATEFQFKYGSIVSETYGVLDCTAIDYGTDLNYNDSIWNSVNRFSRGLEYTTFTHTSLANVYNTITGDVCIEFDASASMVNYSTLFSVRSDSTALLQATRSQLQMQENTFYHIKVEIKNNTATITNMDTNKSVTGNVTGATRFYLRIDANETILFKNYMIYPI